MNMNEFSEKEPITTVDCTPKMSPERYLEIFNMNMACLRKEFGPGWTRTKKIDATDMQKAIDARYAFIKPWYEMLEADLYLLDYIAQVKRYGRQHLPGEISMFELRHPKVHIDLVARGKSISPEFRARVKDIFAQGIIIYGFDKGEVTRHLRGFLFDEGYEIVDNFKSVSPIRVG